MKATVQLLAALPEARSHQPAAPLRSRSAPLVARLRRLRADDWARTAWHDDYNSYSIFTMFRHLALHDFHHAYRIEELLLRKDWPAPLFA